jgi:signal transduction histidine kinase
MLFCDGDLIVRVLQNLLSNAIRFTPSGGRIRLDAALVKPGWAQFRVRDTGVGIASEALPYIFERYYRGNIHDRRSNGIGLYFCRLAVEAHGGTIRADSQVGVGTTITLIVPLRAH